MSALPRGTRQRLGPWERTPNTEASWEPSPGRPPGWLGGAAARPGPGSERPAAGTPGLVGLQPQKASPQALEALLSARPGPSPLLDSGEGAGGRGKGGGRATALRWHGCGPGGSAQELVPEG